MVLVRRLVSMRVVLKGVRLLINRRKLVSVKRMRWTRRNWTFNLTLHLENLRNVAAELN